MKVRISMKNYVEFSEIEIGQFCIYKGQAFFKIGKGSAFKLGDAVQPDRQPA